MGSADDIRQTTIKLFKHLDREDLKFLSSRTTYAVRLFTNKELYLKSKYKL